MAIPCFVPYDDPEENYRRLERLLYELYHVLRALLGPIPQNQTHQGNTGHHGHGPNPPPSGAGGAGGSSGGSSGGEMAHAAGRSRRGRRTTSAASGATSTAMPAPQSPHSGRMAGLMNISYHPGDSTPASPTESWTKLGGDLRLIADTFSASRHQRQPRTTQCGKTSSLQLAAAALSLLRSSWSEAD